MGAALTISIKSDVDKLKKQLDDFARNQLPFATAKALNAVARGAKQDVDAAIGSKFDRPTPFTQNAASVQLARKTNQRVMIFVKDRQAGYLELQETGGTRFPKKIALVLPVGINLNQYGNMPKGALQRLKGKSDIFVGSVRMKSGHIIGGFWQRRPGNHLKLIAAFRPSAEYKPRFGYHQTIQTVVTKQLPAQLKKALDDAIKTARR